VHILDRDLGRFITIGEADIAPFIENTMEEIYRNALVKAVREDNRIVVTRVKRAEKFKREKIVFTLDGNYVVSSVLQELFGFDIYARLTRALPITYDE